MAFNKTVLDNGLKIITAPQPGNLAVTVLVLVEAGSKYEAKDINGISHFLEHMCFKGTKKRPTVLQITSELDGLGGVHNAFTSHEYTGYYAKAEARHLDKVLDIVSDIYLNPVFDEKEMDKERGVIIEEINMCEDEFGHKVAVLFLELMYGDQPAGWDVGGTKENIRKITCADMMKYRSEHYLPQATIVAGAGSFDEPALLGKIKATFGAMPKGNKVGKVKTTESQKKPEILLSEKKLEQTHIMLGVRAYDAFDDRRFALDVLSGVLGLGMSSRLFQEVREKLGAAYYISSSTDLYTDHGYLAVAAGIDRKKFQVVISAIIGEFKKLRDELVPNDELEKVKNHIAGNLTLGLETSNSLANFYGIQELVEKAIMTPAQIIERFNAVTSEEIRNVARDIFKNEKLNLAVLGPAEDKAMLEAWLKLD